MLPKILSTITDKLNKTMIICIQILKRKWLERKQMGYSSHILSIIIVVITDVYSVNLNGLLFKAERGRLLT